MSELQVVSPEQEEKAVVNFELPSEYENIAKVETSPEDSEGFVRPMYTIDGIDRKIVFVNSKEQAEINGEGEDFSKIPTTPEAMLAVAIDARPDDPKLRQMLDNITEKTYTADEIGLIDDISAAVAIDSSGRIASQDQTEGFALVISALAGNEQARELIDKKRDQYYEHIESMKKNEESESSREAEPGKALEWGQVAFVHSTGHELIRDDNGEIILYPYSYHQAGTEQSYPRATIHFTVNSEVKGHLFGSWEASNRLIVMNGQTFVDENGYPARMNVIDTYWSQAPGEPLTLEGATIVEPSKDLAELFVEDREKHTISYLDKEEYSDEERRAIFILQQEKWIKSKYPESEWDYHLDLYKDSTSPFVMERVESLRGKESSTLREIALAAAMKQQGVETPTVELYQWSSSNPEFDAGYGSLASELGIPLGIHSGSPEERLESTSASSSYSSENPYSRFTYGKLAAQQTLVAYGFIMPKKVTTKKPDDRSLF